MIKIQLATQEHVRAITPKDIFLDNPDLIMVLGREVATGVPYTLVGPEGEILAIIGCTCVNRTTAEIWSVTSPLVEKYPIAFHRTCLGLLNRFSSLYRIKRMQLVVKDGYYQGLTWASRLGFSLEGTMKSYGCDGSDYLLMGRVF